LRGEIAVRQAGARLGTLPPSLALDTFHARGLDRSLHREAAARRRTRSSIRDEVRRLSADEHDREEMRIIREQLAELAPPPTD
jgi:hypothetical protein